MRWFNKLGLVSTLTLSVASAQTLGPPGGGGGSGATPGGTSGQIQTNNGAGGFGALAVPLPAASGGTGEAGTVTGALKGNGTSAVTQAACADLSNAATSCATDATNATNISTGTLAAARGGAGTVNGVLSGNGSGVVSQGATTGLSDTTPDTAWTPTDNSGASLTLTGSARYTKIGKMVTAIFRMSYPTTASANQISIAGLPVAASANYPGGNTIAGSCYIIGGATNVLLAPIILASGTTLSFINNIAVVPTNVTLSTLTLTCALTYISV